MLNLAVPPWTARACLTAVAMLAGLSSCMVAVACGGGDGPQPPVSPSSNASRRAVVAVGSVTAGGQREGSEGYRYTVTAVARETGGVSASLTAWDVSFFSGSAEIGAVHFDSSNFGSLATTVAPNSSTSPQEFTITDTRRGNPYATTVTVKLTYREGNTSSTSSGSAEVTPLRSPLPPVPPAPPPAPPPPPPAPPRPTCSAICWACASGNSFGAVAYSPSGTCGWASESSSRAAAESRAIQECARGDCFVAVWFQNQCGAVARASNGQWGSGLGGSPSAAESAALANCDTGDSGPGLPQPACVPTGGAGVTVPVTNTTNYSVRVTFTGPVTRSATIASGGTQTLTLNAGTYTATGEVLNAGNVTFRPSTWTVSSGCSYPLQILLANR
jgi:hypothetical protein